MIARITFSVPVPRIDTHRQRHDDQRERHEDIHDALEDEVEQPAEIGAGDPQNEAKEAADRRRGETDEQRRAGAVNDAGIDIAAEHVGAEDEIPSGGTSMYS